MTFEPEKDICPFCGKEELIRCPGDTIDVGFGDNYQVAPDEYECYYCGFAYQQDTKFTMDKLIEKHKKVVKKRLREALNWCNYLIKKL